MLIALQSLSLFFTIVFVHKVQYYDLYPLIWGINCSVYYFWRKKNIEIL